MHDRNLQLAMLNQRVGRPRHRLSEQGFTLPELLVATTIALSVVAAVGSLVSSHLARIQDQVRLNALQINARDVVDLFTREARRAGTNPTCNGAIVAIADAKQTSLRITADLDGNGDTTGQGEDVTYQYRFDQDRFERYSNGSTDILMIDADLTGSRIRYFDGSGVELPAGLNGLGGSLRAAVRRVRIELVATRTAMDPSNTALLRVQLANDIDLRNRYFANPVSCP